MKQMFGVVILMSVFALMFVAIAMTHGGVLVAAGIFGIAITITAMIVVAVDMIV